MCARMHMRHLGRGRGRACAAHARARMRMHMRLRLRMHMRMPTSAEHETAAEVARAVEDVWDADTEEKEVEQLLARGASGLGPGSGASLA